MASTATRSVSSSAASMSGFEIACGIHFRVRPGGGKVYADCSVVNEYRKISHIGTCRKSSAAAAASFKEPRCALGIWLAAAA